MAVLGDLEPKIFWVVIFAFHMVQSVPTGGKQQLVICENGHAEIQCPRGTKITIINAYYGRTDAQTCPNGSIQDLNCKASNCEDIIRKKCENNFKCHLEATNSLFGDPCPNTYKYLEVHYVCNKDPADNIKTSTICESKTQKIKCPKNTRLVIDDAFYGRTDKSICPHQQIKDLQCKAANSFQIVNERCNHKPECELQSSNSWFGDPCVGTYKYLQIKYKCVEDPVNNLQTSTICESDNQKIKCPHDTSLVIEDAFYGRTDKNICPHQQIKDVHCKAANAFQIVNERCNHKSECELQSSNSWFGDPCEGTNKYLQIKYKCQ